MNKISAIGSEYMPGEEDGEIIADDLEELDGEEGEGVVE